MVRILFSCLYAITCALSAANCVPLPATHTSPSICFFYQRSLTANVTVCHLSVTINASPAYMRYSNITINYALQTSTDCSTGSISGTFNLNTTNNTLVRTKSLTVNNINSTSEKYKISINTTALQNTTYVAWVSFKKAGIANSTDKSFSLVNPANIIITNFYASPHSMSVGSKPICILISYIFNIEDYFVLNKFQIFKF